MRTLVGTLFGTPLAVGFSTLAVTHLLWLLSSIRFLFPNVLLEPAGKFRAGAPEDLATGEVDTRHVAQHGAWIVRDEYEGRQQVFALKAVCTHLGCTPLWLEGERKFKCPCHGSGFYRNGVNFEGPAPRPLERFAIRIGEDGLMEVDTSRTFQQELGQWRDPASFIAI
jgi:cytochrome b6-f complex iron-sulfur subunit